MRLGLLGECLGGMHFIYVDNIKVTDKSSGIDDITISGTDVNIATVDGTIIVTASAELPISVYTPDGRMMAGRTAARATFTLTSGVYIVKAGTRTAKVVL